MLDRLHENVFWGMRGNFLSIPTDCPQRDERLGWTGDIQVFAPTAEQLADLIAFITTIDDETPTIDVPAGQRICPTGSVPQKQ